MRFIATSTLAILLSACSYMGGGSGKPAKHSFEPPAGAFNVRESIDNMRSKPKEGEESAKPAEGTAAPAAAAESSEVPPETAPAEAAPAEKAESVLPPRARPANGKSGAAIFPPKQGLPSEMLLTGSAREADVRAERLHRYLTEKDAPALPGKVIVDVGGGGKLSVVLEIPAEKAPTLEDLRNIAKSVTSSALKAVPEAQIPEDVVTIEVRSGKYKIGTWEEGGWKLEESPPAFKEFKKQIKQ